MSQFIAQGTKVNPCKFETTKDNVTSFVMPNNTHLAPFVDLILTLIWDPLNESVFFLRHATTTGYLLEGKPSLGHPSP